MAQERNSSAQEAATESAASAIHPRSRRLRRLGIIVIVIVALLGLVLFFAPRYVARYLIASQLDQLGIDHEGVETLNINLWTRELWLGPVRFGTGPSDRGQVGELGLTIRFNPLLKRRVSIERLLVRGIDVVVTRGKDNALALSGIPLTQFMQPAEAAASPAVEGDAWGAGIDAFELRDSRLIFKEGDRGDLQVDVERLALMEFETWAPDRPGRFELAARVNDIQLSWSGEARPFADTITLAIDSRTEQADVPKVVRFTGPWGLDRRDGTYDAELKYEVTLFDSGRLEGHTVGTIDIRDASYERAGEFALALERAKVDLDVRYMLSESGDFALQGQVAMDLERSSGGLADETRFAAAAGRVVLSGLDAAYAQNGALRVDLQPDIDLESVEFSGPIEVSVDTVLELLALLQSLSATDAVSSASTGLGDYAGSSITVPSSDVKVGRLTSKGESFSLQSAEGQVELGLQGSSDLFDIQIVGGQGRIEIERLQGVLERLSVTSGQGRLAVDMAGSNSLEAGTGGGPRGALEIAAFEAKVGKLGLQAQTGAVSLQLSALAGKVSGFSGLVYAAEGLPEAQLRLGSASAAFDEASLDAQAGALRWQVGGGAAVESLTADVAKGKEGALKFGRAEIKALQANDRLQLAADALTVDGLDLYVKRSLVKAFVGDGGASPGDAARGVDVSRVQALLTQLGYAPGPVDGLMGRGTAAAISEFQGREGLVVDGRLTGSLLAALESQAAAPADTDAAPAPRTDVAKPAGATVRAGRLALTGNPVIRFRDETVTPQVTVHTVFKEARIQNFNTQKVDQRSDLSVVADVNEFTHVAVAGWIAGLGDTADMDVKATLENLELSTYSPYVAELAGVYLESGQLDTVTVAKTQQGVLQGEIQLELDDIAFRPLSKEDAERLSGTVGLPLETAVSLLQDDDGRIALTLPVSGTLSKPKVDISSAVNKAIGGALTKVFPPTMVASILGGIVNRAGPSFEPIEFAPGSAELAEAAKRYANDLVQLMAEHPKLSLKVCGRSTARDMEPFMTKIGTAVPSASRGKGQAGQPEAKPVADPAQIDQALVELAEDRGRALRRYLIQEKGADAKRLPECRSTFEAADQGSPRVEISL